MKFDSRNPRKEKKTNEMELSRTFLHRIIARRCFVRSKSVIYQTAQSSGELVLVTTPPQPRPPPTTGTLTQLIHLWKRCQHSRGCRSVDARPSAYPTEKLRNNTIIISFPNHKYTTSISVTFIPIVYSDIFWNLSLRF